MTMVTSLYKPQNGYYAPTYITLGFPELLTSFQPYIPDDSQTITKTRIQNLNFSIPV